MVKQQCVVTKGVVSIAEQRWKVKHDGRLHLEGQYITIKGPSKTELA